MYVFSLHAKYKSIRQETLHVLCIGTPECGRNPMQLLSSTGRLYSDTTILPAIDGSKALGDCLVALVWSIFSLSSLYRKQPRQQSCVAWPGLRLKKGVKPPTSNPRYIRTHARTHGAYCTAGNQFDVSNDSILSTRDSKTAKHAYKRSPPNNTTRNFRVKYITTSETRARQTLLPSRLRHWWGCRPLTLTLRPSPSLPHSSMCPRTALVSIQPMVDRRIPEVPTL